MEDRLGEIQIRAALATPAPLEVGIINRELDPVAWFKEHLEGADSPDTDVWVIWCPLHPDSKPDPDGKPEFAILAAITGNGPTSEANAEFFANARDDVPWLIDELERARAGIEMAYTAAGGATGEACAIIAENFEHTCSCHTPELIAERIRSRQDR